MSDHAAAPKPFWARMKFAPVAIVGGVAATAALALSMNGTLAGFTAQITNSNNTAATGTLLMQETGSAGTCTSSDTAANGANPNPNASNSINTNSYTCSTINKYGGATALVPGATSTASITIKNAGTVNAPTFTLAPGTCSQASNPTAGNTAGSATDLCSRLTLTMTEQVGTGTTTTKINNVALNSLASSYTLAAVASGVTVTYNFTVTLPSTLNNTGGTDVSNTYQGLQASQPLVWKFTS